MFHDNDKASIGNTKVSIKGNYRLALFHNCVLHDWLTYIASLSKLNILNSDNWYNFYDICRVNSCVINLNWRRKHAKNYVWIRMLFINDKSFWNVFTRRWLYHNVNTNTSSNVDLYKLNVKRQAANKMGQTNKIQKQHKNENK